MELAWSGLVGAPGAGGAGEVAEGVGVEVDRELQLFLVAGPFPLPEEGRPRSGVACLEGS